MVDEPSEDEQSDGKPVNNDEKENQCSGTNKAAKSKKKARKKKKKGKTNDDSNIQKDVSSNKKYICRKIMENCDQLYNICLKTILFVQGR